MEVLFKRFRAANTDARKNLKGKKRKEERKKNDTMDMNKPQIYVITC